MIIVASRVLGWLLRWLRQPQVVGEMLAGILLGPSLLGLVAPHIYSQLFPTGSLRFLNALSQIGLLLFMFLVGLELDLRLLRGRGHAAVLTSHASITAPMFLGSALALVLYPRLAERGVSFVAFSLFLGAAMGVTAFPVLARILSERRMRHTRLGTTVVACAAVDDVTAWCVLAVVVAVARDSVSATSAWLTIGGAAVWLLLMLGVVRPALAALYRRQVSMLRVSQDLVAAIIVVILGSALITEWLGVHALFGAFLAGLAMPKEDLLQKGLQEKFEDVMLSLLLPLFFAYTGLRMSVSLLGNGEMWLLCLFVLAVAIAGKLGGAALAAGLSGMPWREAWIVGVLMNTRGLVELIILNVGLDLGVISPTLFTMMVLMALTTTLMTTPLLGWLYPARRVSSPSVSESRRRASDLLNLPQS